MQELWNITLDRNLYVCMYVCELVEYNLIFGWLSALWYSTAAAEMTHLIPSSLIHGIIHYITHIHTYIHTYKHTYIHIHIERLYSASIRYLISPESQQPLPKATWSKYKAFNIYTHQTHTYIYILEYTYKHAYKYFKKTTDTYIHAYINNHRHIHKYINK